MSDRQLCAGWLMTFALVAAMVMPLAVFGQDVPDPTEPDPTELPPEDPLVLQNDAQTDKATRLSEASGLSEQEIIQLRLGTPASEGPDGPIEGTGGTGWGAMCKMLGLHPGILGGGKGNKFSNPPEGAEPGLLARRNTLKNGRLNRSTHTKKLVTFKC
ncbi:MAG: hypothetical protein HQ559_06265 [Lentisphaerae bacterium]|nr:hypothetical protein [Lentisphaerota bacterium]